MAAKTYALTSAVFGEGLGAITITSLTNGTVNETTQETNLTADASRTVNLPIDDMYSVDVTVETMDSSFASSFEPGDTGQLILTGKLRTCGDGLSTEQTITLKSVCVVSVTDGLESQGQSSLTITFRAYDEDADHNSTEIAIISYN